MDDFEEQYERAMEAVEGRAKRRVDGEISRMEQGLAESDPGVGDAPSPLAWHPFYRDQPWLIDWLEGRTSLPEHHLRLPVPRPMRFTFDREIDPSPQVDMNVLVLTKQRAWGPAPYVGEPFAYVWNVAIDQHGRSIAGDAKIVYPGADRG